ncbi:MAG: sugar phosphate isomerase/epimerase [Clostridia bacterium]|nr:sugar phosphate isomerase/epimerase [Clostridia bacterium]
MRFVNYSIFYKDLKNHGLEYAARHTRELGCDAVEFLDFAPLCESSSLNRYTPTEAKRILSEYGLGVSCYSVALNLLEGDPERTVSDLERIIGYAAELGSPRFHHTLVVNLAPSLMSVTYDEALERIYPYAVRIADCCRGHGLTCLYEPQGLYFNGVEGLGRFFAKINRDCPNVGICGDVANGLFADTSAQEIYDAFIDSIQHVHVKDFLVLNSAAEGVKPYVSLGGKYLCECRMGEGVTDFAYCFEKLMAVGYDGDISLEFVGDDEEVHRSMAFVRSFFQEGKL